MPDREKKRRKKEKKRRKEKKILDEILQRANGQAGLKFSSGRTLYTPARLKKKREKEKKRKNNRGSAAAFIILEVSSSRDREQYLTPRATV